MACDTVCWVVAAKTLSLVPREGDYIVIFEAFFLPRPLLVSFRANFPKPPLALMAAVDADDGRSVGYFHFWTPAMGLVTLLAQSWLTFSPNWMDEGGPVGSWFGSTDQAETFPWFLRFTLFFIVYLSRFFYGSADCVS